MGMTQHRLPGEDRTCDLEIKSDALPNELAVLPSLFELVALAQQVARVGFVPYMVRSGHLFCCLNKLCGVFCNLIDFKILLYQYLVTSYL